MNVTPISRHFYERILIAVDGSEPSAWASSVGGQLAKQLGAKVLLIYVVEPNPLAATDTMGGERLEAILAEVGNDLLERVRGSLPLEVETETSLSYGLAADRIVTAARVWKADLIVMGTRGNGRLAGLLFGSNAESVIRRALCPVIAVAHTPHIPATSKAEWTGVGSDTVDPISAHHECAT